MDVGCGEKLVPMGCPPNEHCGGHLDSFPSLLHPKSLYLSLRLFLCVVILLG